jgi:hypothetical protein
VDAQAAGAEADGNAMNHADKVTRQLRLRERVEAALSTVTPTSGHCARDLVTLTIGAIEACEPDGLVLSAEGKEALALALFPMLDKLTDLSDDRKCVATLAGVRMLPAADLAVVEEWFGLPMSDLFKAERERRAGAN